MAHRAQQNTDSAHKNSTSLIEVIVSPGYQITAILKKVAEKIFFLNEIFCSENLQNLKQGGGPYSAYYTKNFLKYSQ